MRSRSLRALAFVCLLSIAVPGFAAPRHDESGFSQLFSRIARVVRHLLPFDTVDPTYPKP
jgi:hypothetical protein